jgi:hypothetical protein
MELAVGNTYAPTEAGDGSEDGLSRERDVNSKIIFRPVVVSHDREKARQTA